MRYKVVPDFVPHVLAGLVVLIVPAGAGAAETIECKAELPATRTGHWSWRSIDGKQCWYPGRPGIAKSRLRWPTEPAAAAASPPDEPAPEPVSIEAESVPLHTQGLSFEPAQELSFEQRWPR